MQRPLLFGLRRAAAAVSHTSFPPPQLPAHTHTHTQTQRGGRATLLQFTPYSTPQRGCARARVCAHSRSPRWRLFFFSYHLLFVFVVRLVSAGGGPPPPLYISERRTRVFARPPLCVLV